MPLKVQRYFHPFQRDLERPLLHLGGIQNKSITLMVVRDPHCIASITFDSIVSQNVCHQMIQLKKCIVRFFPRITKCLLRCPTWLNDFSHSVQLYRYVIVFLHCGRAHESLLYLLRFPAWLNGLKHSEHLCDFSPLWITSLIK